MTNNQLIELLENYPSYKYALRNVGQLDTGLTLMAATRLRNPNEWDATRYARIVAMIEGAVNELLTDDQRMVIMRKYFDRHKTTLTKIADDKHLHCSSTSRWHKEALKRLRVALSPLSAEDVEITNVDHTLTA